MAGPPRFGHTSEGRPVHAHRFDHLPVETTLQRANRWLAVKTTQGVGTMWCAYVFAAIALISLPAAISTHSVIVIVAWVAQTFFQLVLLSVIIVGQNVQAEASETRSVKTLELGTEAHDQLVAILDKLSLDTEGGLQAILEAIERRPGVSRRSPSAGNPR